MMRILDERGITSDRVLEAMNRVHREEFVRPADRLGAYEDRALPLEFRQSISQPLMVALLVQALDITDGDRVLDVGTGSGYQAAVIAACGARVVSVERIPELAESARERLQSLGYDVEVRLGDGGMGLPDIAPFDAIAVGAAVPQIPETLVSQLATGGRLVVPVRTTVSEENLLRITLQGGERIIDDLGACRFVPLIGHEGFSN
jgi:protein-L-isoaspartate(D-aspartate) O-methyltransferase